MSELQWTLDRLMTLPMFVAERPATPDEIGRIQTELRVTLPPQYVEFLQRFGYVGWFGHEILGIRPIDRATGAPSTVTSDCVTKTKEERDNPRGISFLPPDHVVISSDGSGGKSVLFTVGSADAGQVHWYNLEDMPEPIMTWQTLRDYLEYRIDDAK